MDSLYIVMPAYNEETNIEKTIREWYKIVNKVNFENKNDLSRLVVFNDGSKDKTLEIASSLVKDMPFLTVIDKQNSGHGPTVIQAYNYAIKSKAKFVFMTDSDGQTNPKEFDIFWNKRNEYNAIFGVRKVRGDGRFRKFVEQVVCLLLRIIFGVKVKDANAPFRLMNVSCLSKYINRIPNNYNLPNIMITAFFAFYNEKICFQEISFNKRSAGKNSINYKRIFKIGCKALIDFYKFKKSM